MAHIEPSFYGVKRAEEVTEVCEVLRKVGHPRGGWLQAARSTRGATQKSLATKLGFKRQAWAQLELSEARGAISLYSLRRAADALGYDLVYALVSREETGTGDAVPVAVAATGVAPAPEEVAAPVGGEEATPVVVPPRQEAETPVFTNWDTDELPTELR